MSGLTDAINLTMHPYWSAVTGATSYEVYRYDTNDPTYKPVDADYLLLTSLAGTDYSDTGALTPAGAMPVTAPDWYVTEIEQKYTMPDTAEATPGSLVASGSCIDLRDNLANIRFMLKSVNGQASWLTAPSTNLYMITNGKSGGQTFTGGTGASENLTLESTSSGTKGSIILNSGSGNVLIGTTTNPSSYKVNIIGGVGITGAMTISGTITANGTPGVQGSLTGNVTGNCSGNCDTVDSYHVDASGAANNQIVIFDVSNSKLKTAGTTLANASVNYANTAGSVAGMITASGMSNGYIPTATSASALTNSSIQDIHQLYGANSYGIILENSGQFWISYPTAGIDAGIAKFYFYTDSKYAINIYRNVGTNPTVALGNIGAPQAISSGGTYCVVVDDSSRNWLSRKSLEFDSNANILSKTGRGNVFKIYTVDDQALQLGYNSNDDMIVLNPQGAVFTVGIVAQLGVSISLNQSLTCGTGCSIGAGGAYFANAYITTAYLTNIYSVTNLGSVGTPVTTGYFTNGNITTAYLTNIYSVTNLGSSATPVTNGWITYLGTSGQKVNTAYISTLYLGDLNLINGWKLDDSTENLLWVSPAGKRYKMHLEEVA
jgi:hypothetical protein